jgi:DNA-binding NarL/FixJ family response regulator
MPTGMTDAEHPGARGEQTDARGSSRPGPAPGAERLRVMLVDAHALIRSGCRRILEAEADMHVVADTADDLDALDVLQAREVDVILLAMSVVAGDISAVRNFLRVRPAVRVLVVSQFPEPHRVKLAFDAGARGYLFTRYAMGIDLVRAVRTIAAGESYISPELSEGLVRALQAGGREHLDPYERLTRREKQVLQLIAQGKSGREIARLLGLSANTVAVHRAKAMNRLGIHKTAGLVMFAYERGLVVTE